VTVAIVVLIVVTGMTLALSGFLGWLLVGRERARERAAFLADSGALADALRAEAERSSPVPRDDVAIVALRYMPPGRGPLGPNRAERHGVVRAGEPA